MNFFNTKIKPNISELTDQELIEIIKKDNEIADTNNLSRDEMILKVNNIWDNLVLGPDIDCPICLEIITNEDNMITNCGHYFHSSCMIKYIVKSKSNNPICCPKCRTNIYSEDEPNNNEYTDENTNNNNDNNNPHTNWISNINHQLMSNFDSNFNSDSDSDSDSDSNSDSNSEFEPDPYSNIRHQNQMSGVNSTVLNYFRGSNIPIDIVSGLWTNQIINNIDIFNNTNQSNLNPTNINTNTNTNTNTDSD